MDFYMFFILILLLTIIPQVIVHVVYNKYANIKTTASRTGLDVVNSMLQENLINDVRVSRISGELTDNYNSQDKTIYLSASNYQEPTVASIAVAAHECAHAIQDHNNYFFLRMRQSLGPVTIVASRLTWIFIYLGFILFFTPFIYIGIALLAVIVIFDFVTLPVEINASRRAKKYLADTGTYSDEEIKGAGKVLIAAAFTYVAATLAGVLQLIRLISRVRRD